MAQLEKMENSIEVGLKAVNLKIDTLNSQDIMNLKLQVARLETRLVMMTAILGAVGIAALGLGLKALFNK